MKKALVLGAGSVSRPCVQYLLRQGCEVVVVDLLPENARRAVGGHPNGTALAGNGAENAAELIRGHKPDVVVCLLPTAFMARTAKTCVDEGVSMIGASYVKDETRRLDAEARARGVKILCEAGLDPGIDHMSAVTKIRELQAGGGEIESFISVCGALPDLSSNTNPVGYKLSWAPASLIGASKRSARILVDGREIDLPDGATYQRPSFSYVEGLGWFETYANADSLPYLEAYGIATAKTIVRGTLRYFGWCDMVTQMQKLRLFDEEERDFSGHTYASLMKALAKCPDAPSAREGAARFLGIEPYSPSLLKLEWLGFFDDLPVSPRRGSPRDVTAGLYAEKLVFQPGERDLVAMQHEYVVSCPDAGGRKKFTSTLVNRGSVDEDTAIARTTGLPMGIAANLVLSGRVRGDGVLIPTTEDICIPCLEELTREGVRFEESESFV